MRTVAALLLLALWVRAAIPAGYMPVPATDQQGWWSLGFCGVRATKPPPVKAAFFHGGDACLFAMAAGLAPTTGLDALHLRHPLFLGRLTARASSLSLLIVLGLPPPRGPPTW